MPMCSYYSDFELVQCRIQVLEQRPELIELLDEVNAQLKCEQRYAVFCQQLYIKRWPWSKTEKDRLHVELLWGSISNSCEMQIICLGEGGSYESYLMGILNGLDQQKRNLKTAAKTSWEKFITHLDKVEGFENKSLFGSVERYKKLFLEANDGTK